MHDAGRQLLAEDALFQHPNQRPNDALLGALGDHEHVFAVNSGGQVLSILGVFHSRLLKPIVDYPLSLDENGEY